MLNEQSSENQVKVWFQSRHTKWRKKLSRDLFEPIESLLDRSYGRNEPMKFTNSASSNLMKLCNDRSNVYR